MATDLTVSSKKTRPDAQFSDSVSILLPAYNEEEGIETTIQQLMKLLEGSSIVKEIIVIDDGSDDSTAEIVDRFQDIILVRHSTNRGYGAALKTGIRRASGTLICITDADGTYPNHRIPEFSNYLIDHGLDMVVGARIGDNVSIPLVRRPPKWALSKIANYSVGREIPDLNSGLRVFQRSAALTFIKLLPDGFSFTTTITLAMLSNDFLVEYIPINYHERLGKSKIRPFRDTLHFLQLIIRTGMYFAPLKTFLPIAGLLFIATLVSLFYDIEPPREYRRLIYVSTASRV